MRGWLLFGTFIACWLSGSGCKEGERSALTGSCHSSYLECVSGGQVVRSCGFGRLFDREALECQWFWEGECLLGQGCEEGELRPHQTDPRLYYDCRAGIPDLKFCPPSEVFVPETGLCGYALGNGTVPTCEDGSRKPEDDCNKYSLCFNGTWIGETCPPGYNFDVASLMCQQQYKAHCLKCTDSPDTRSCSSYYACEKGIKIKKNCSFLKKWDAISKQCVFFGAHCGSV